MIIRPTFHQEVPDTDTHFLICSVMCQSETFLQPAAAVIQQSADAMMVSLSGCLLVPQIVM